MRQPAERPRDLEGAADAAIDDAVRRAARDLVALEADRARGRRQRAGEHVEDRALARAVRADQAEDLALLDLERHVVDGGEAAEALDQPLDRQHAGVRVAGVQLRHSPRRACRPAAAAPARAAAGSSATPRTPCRRRTAMTTGKARSFWPAIGLALACELDAEARAWCRLPAGRRRAPPCAARRRRCRRTS